MAEFAGCSERTVDRIIAQLSAWGAVKSEGQTRSASAGKFQRAQFSFPFADSDESVASVRQPCANSLFVAEEPCAKNEITVRQNGDRNKEVSLKDLKPESSKAKQHGFAELSETDEIAFWIEFKNQLRDELPEAEWNLWLRPLLLLSSSRGMLLLALPRNGQIAAAARARQQWLREKLAPTGHCCALTHYPDDWQLDTLRERFPEHYAKLAPSVVAKHEAQSARASPVREFTRSLRLSHLSRLSRLA